MTTLLYVQSQTWQHSFARFIDTHVDEKTISAHQFYEKKAKTFEKFKGKKESFTCTVTNCLLRTGNHLKNLTFFFVVSVEFAIGFKVTTLLKLLIWSDDVSGFLSFSLVISSFVHF